tara:strand:+ start:8049 stop:8768 length:720 start_codon:yes stop_codon:yes gene_type:complete
MNNTLPKAVIFDLDDTLYSYELCHDLALKKVQFKLKNEFGVSENKFIQLYSQANKEVKYNLGRVSSSHNKFLYFKNILEKIGFKPYVYSALAIEELYWQTFFDNIEPFKGLKELFETLRLLNIKSGIITNFSAYHQFKKVVYLGIEDYIDHIISSEELGCEKPQPKLFKDMIEILDVSFGEIWMVGNSVKEDIEPAKETIGAKTFLISHKSLQNSEKLKADFVFKDFNFINKKLLKSNI